MADSRVGGEEEERRKPGMADNSEWWSWAMEQESDGESALSSTEVEFPWEGSDERFAQTQIAVTGVGGHAARSIGTEADERPKRLQRSKPGTQRTMMDALFKLVSSRAPARASSTDSPHESSADFGMDHGAARDIAPGVAQEVAHTNIVGMLHSNAGRGDGYKGRVLARESGRRMKLDGAMTLDNGKAGRKQEVRKDERTLSSGAANDTRESMHVLQQSYAERRLEATSSTTNYFLQRPGWLSSATARGLVHNQARTHL